MEEIEDDDGFPLIDINEEEFPPLTEQLEDHNPVESDELNLLAVHVNLESGAEENHIESDDLSLLPVVDDLKSESQDKPIEKLSGVNLLLQINTDLEAGYLGKTIQSGKC